eukprot:314921_1
MLPLILLGCLFHYTLVNSMDVISVMNSTLLNVQSKTTNHKDCIGVYEKDIIQSVPVDCVGLGLLNSSIFPIIPFKKSSDGMLNNDCWLFLSENELGQVIWQIVEQQLISPEIIIQTQLSNVYQILYASGNSDWTVQMMFDHNKIQNLVYSFTKLYYEIEDLTLEIHHETTEQNVNDSLIHALAAYGINFTSIDQLRDAIRNSEDYKKLLNDKDIKLIGITSFFTVIIIWIPWLFNCFKREKRVIAVAARSQHRNKMHNMPVLLQRRRTNQVIKPDKCQPVILKQVHCKPERLQQILQNGNATNEALMSDVINDINNENNEGDDETGPIP